MVAQLYRKGADGLWRSPGRPSLGSVDDAARPEGPGYVRYEDLYVVGDTVTDAMNRLTDPAIVTFPEGEFLLTDFTAETPGGIRTGGAINLDKDRVLGIIGSGRGTLGGTSGTIFRMAPMSSTLGDTAATPSQAQGGTTQVWMIRSVDGAGPITLKNFQVVGSAQGHNYNGINVFNPNGAVNVENVLVAGWEGDNGAPPGETFGLSVYQCGPGKTIMRNCEVDGRREIGGEWFGAAGLTFGRSLNAEVIDCQAHHTRHASMIVYRSFDSSFTNCVMGVDSTDGLPSGFNGWPFNSEHADNIVLQDCELWKSRTGQGVHVTWSNSFLTVNESGWPSGRSCTNGQATINNPTYNDIWGDGYFYVESWTTGIDGRNDDSMVDPIDVNKADGTNLPYKWAHGAPPHQIIA